MVDRTSLVVTLGILTLFIVGVITVFGGPLLAIVSPVPEHHAAPVTAAPVPGP